MLHGKRRIEVMLIVFDVLAIDGPPILGAPATARRPRLGGRLLVDHAQLRRRRIAVDKICELGLEGVVAKKRSGHYLPGRRRWIKTKNRASWRYPLELEAAWHPKDREGGGPVESS
jgi:ATP-dependent DNA ligase